MTTVLTLTVDEARAKRRGLKRILVHDLDTDRDELRGMLLRGGTCDRALRARRMFEGPRLTS